MDSFSREDFTDSWPRCLRKPDSRSTGTWNFFRSETLGREEIWVTFEFDFESRSHILIAEFGIEFKRWHESKIDLTIISKFSTKCINIARSSWDQVERGSDELRYSLIVFLIKIFFQIYIWLDLYKLERRNNEKTVLQGGKWNTKKRFVVINNEETNWYWWKGKNILLARKKKERNGLKK